MAIKWHTPQIYYQGQHRRTTRQPESQRPHAFVLNIAQHSIGEERPQVQSQVEPAEKTDFGRSFFSIFFIKLVCSKCCYGRLVSSIAKGYKIYGQIEDAIL